jgi:hypothetical protein
VKSDGREENALPRVMVKLVPLLLLLGSAQGEEPVHFTDASLQEAVEAELWIADPTPTDMLGLFSLDAGSRRISSLTGLEYAANMRTLRLRFNQISDLSPLSGLSNLDFLSASENQISDLSALSGLTNLVTLELNDNRIRDPSPVGGLTNLSTLDMHNNRISDVSPLAALTNLRTLALRENPLGDISALAALTQLHHLCILETNVSDLSPLLGLKTLGYLDLRHCPLSDISWDVYLPQIRANNPGIQIETDPHRGRILWTSSTAGGSVIEPGEGEFALAYDTWLRLTAQADPGYVFVGWSGTYPTTQNPTHLTMGQDYEMRANFVSLLSTLHVDDDAVGDPGPGDPALSDPNENGTPEHPFDSIQEAIEVAGQGTSITVHPGTYRESLDSLGKSIHLMGTDPCNPCGGPCAVIEGADTRPAVRFTGVTAPCSLTDFVITRGKGQPAGAIHCDGASPTITHCLIVGNRSSDPNGAAVYCRASRAILTNCTIADNYAGANGAGLTLTDSDVTVTNSILWGNRPTEILAGGTSQPRIRYCDVQGWWPDYGDLKTDPGFARQGSWVHPSDPEQILSPGDSRAVWLDGDYHLQSQAGRWDPALYTWVPDAVTSPCIDSGEQTTPIGYEPEPNGGRVNMGAYGGTSEASKSHSQTVSSNDTPRG